MKDYMVIELLLRAFKKSKFLSTYKVAIEINKLGIKYCHVGIIKVTLETHKSENMVRVSFDYILNILIRSRETRAES